MATLKSHITNTVTVTHTTPKAGRLKMAPRRYRPRHVSKKENKESTPRPVWEKGMVSKPFINLKLLLHISTFPVFSPGTVKNDAP